MPCTSNADNPNGAAASGDHHLLYRAFIKHLQLEAQQSAQEGTLPLFSLSIYEAVFCCFLAEITPCHAILFASTLRQRFIGGLVDSVASRGRHLLLFHLGYVD